MARRAVPLLLVELLRMASGAEGLVRASGPAATRTTWPPTSSITSPICRSWSGWHGASSTPCAWRWPRTRASWRCSARTVSIPDVAGVLARLDEQGDHAALPLDATVAAAASSPGRPARAGRDGPVGFRHGLVREEIAKGVPRGRCGSASTWPRRCTTRRPPATPRRRSRRARARPPRPSPTTSAGSPARVPRGARRAHHLGRERLPHPRGAVRARHAYLPAERA